MGALWEALNARQDRATLLLGLSEMTRELETHFATEAAHMDAHPYAGAAAHLADHVRALQAARSLAAHVDERSLALGIRFLYDWLLSHIQSYDAELSRARSD
jgi:hemerythrin-like metal-binding protein